MVHPCHSDTTGSKVMIYSSKSNVMAKVKPNFFMAQNFYKSGKCLGRKNKIRMCKYEALLMHTLTLLLCLRKTHQLVPVIYLLVAILICSRKGAFNHGLRSDQASRWEYTEKMCSQVFKMDKTN